MNSDCLNSNSALLEYPTEDEFSGMDVEFLKGSFGTICYLSIHSRCLNFSTNQSETVHCIRGQEVYLFEGVTLEGKQRVLLFENTAQFLLDSLNDGYEITLSIPEYSATITPDGFTKKYRRFTSLTTAHIISE